MPRRTLYLLPTYKVGCSKLKYQAGGDCVEKALSAALCGLKAQQVPSRATPWVPCPHSLRPVRAKVKANRSPILLPLQGVGVYTLIPRALPWALDWLPFQGAPFRTLFVYHVRMLRHLLFGSKTRRDFLNLKLPTPKAPCGRLQRHKRKEKRCTPKRTLVYTFY